MTIAISKNADDIRWYQFYRWLNPFACQKALLVTHLEPEEIRDTLWPCLDQSYEPDSKQQFLDFVATAGSFLTGLPGMSAEERAHRMHHLGRLFRDGNAGRFPVEGSAHPGGFSLWHATNVNRTLRATYRPGAHGTTIEVNFGLERPGSALSGALSSLIVLLVLASLTGSFAMSDLVHPPTDGVLPAFALIFFSLFGFLMVLLFMGILVPLNVASIWVHRHDFEILMTFLADTISAQEIEATR